MYHIYIIHAAPVKPQSWPRQRKKVNIAVVLVMAWRKHSQSQPHDTHQKI